MTSNTGGECTGSIIAEDQINQRTPEKLSSSPPSEYLQVWGRRNVCLMKLKEEEIESCAF